MIYKSETPLFCRCCGKHIRKHTEREYVKQSRGEHDRALGRVHYGTFRNKAECEVATPDKVISIRYGNDCILSFTTWDRVSYVDRYFCTKKCAIRFAHHYAALDAGMPAFRQRLENTPRVGGRRRVAL
ncbi:MAG TPA: hypothetical protein VLJ17_24680 [Xanthobacteraceae bacterium]|nr:hypothetical protein [Xanthobacteraceae bacterium]